MSRLFYRSGGVGIGLLLFLSIAFEPAPPPAIRVLGFDRDLYNRVYRIVIDNPGDRTLSFEQSAERHSVDGGLKSCGQVWAGSKENERVFEIFLSKKQGAFGWDPFAEFSGYQRINIAPGEAKPLFLIVSADRLENLSHSERVEGLQLKLVYKDGSKPSKITQFLSRVGEQLTNYPSIAFAAVWFPSTNERLTIQSELPL